MEKSLDLQHLELLSMRSKLTSEEASQLFLMTLGYEGELQFLNLMQPLMHRDWHLLSDLTFETEGRLKIQIDFLLLTNSCIFLFDVKNLTKYYTYENDSWYANDERKSWDYFHQLKRTFNIFQGVLDDLQIEMPLKRKLVLINKEDTVHFKQDMSDLVLQPWNIKKFVQGISSSEFQSRQIYDLDRIRDLILRHQSVKISYAKTDARNRPIVGGLFCPVCRKKSLESVSRYYVLCKYCGLHEPKRVSVMRAICEYSVIYLTESATKRELMEFLGDEELRGTLRYVLHDSFESICSGRGKATHYKLPMKINKYVFPVIQFRNKLYSEY